MAWYAEPEENYYVDAGAVEAHAKNEKDPLFHYKIQNNMSIIEQNTDVLEFFDREMAFLESLGLNLPPIKIKEATRAVLEAAAAQAYFESVNGNNIPIDVFVYGAASVLMSVSSGQSLWHLTDEPEQWENAKGMYLRHVRNKYVRKHKRTGIVEYERAIAWQRPDFTRFFDETSVAPIMLPMKPKTFFISVNEEGDVTDEQALAEYAAYYHVPRPIIGK